MTLGDGTVDAGLIVGSIADERGEWSCDLIEQGLDLLAIIDIVGRQLRCEDLTGIQVSSKV